LKAVMLKKPFCVEVVDVPEPQIKDDDEIKVKVEYTAVCADEIKNYKGIITFTDSFLLGHESSGIIVDCGKSARNYGWNIGDRVSGQPWRFCGNCYYCRNGYENLCNNLNWKSGTMAEYVVWKHNKTCLLPDKTTLKEGCLTELLSTCIHGTDLAEIRAGTTVIILGGGGAGLIFLQLALLRGASRVTIVEPVKQKRDLALKLGASYVIDPNSENVMAKTAKITDTIGFNVVIEATNTTSMLPYAIQLLSKKGILLVFSLFPVGYKFPVDLAEMYVKEATIKTSLMAPYMDFRAMEIIKKIDLASLITMEIPIDEVKRAFEEQLTGLHPRVVIKH